MRPSQNQLPQSFRDFRRASLGGTERVRVNSAARQWSSAVIIALNTVEAGKLIIWTSTYVRIRLQGDYQLGDTLTH